MGMETTLARCFWSKININPFAWNLARGMASLMVVHHSCGFQICKHNSPSHDGNGIHRIESIDEKSYCHSGNSSGNSGFRFRYKTIDLISLSFSYLRRCRRRQNRHILPQSNIFYEDDDAYLNFARMSKFIGVPYPWFGFQVENLSIHIKWVDTNDQLADQFTKRFNWPISLCWQGIDGMVTMTVEMECYSIYCTDRILIWWKAFLAQTVVYRAICAVTTELIVI